MINFSPLIQPLPSLFPGYPTVAVLRLDEIDPVISGNKWYKLAPYVQLALEAGCKRIITAGGAYSNHLVATARAARRAGLNSMAWIRGEKPQQLSPTLQDALKDGMELMFMERADYAALRLPAGKMADSDDYFIPSGGSGLPGVVGAAEIVRAAATQSFSHIVGACGTGTMIAGIQYAAAPHQTIVGISVLKNIPEPAPTIELHLKALRCERLPEIMHFPYGGYAKQHPDVFECMREAWQKEKLPLDFVYTGKLFCAVRQLRQNHYFPEEATILLIHSGGLQGNRSLPAGSLPF
jgi:1-aminocyclopropane-1-carboxylate deaminase/D-cysteine desulfhydrase-like pyridoxal-dependent ACC family enzyme